MQEPDDYGRSPAETLATVGSHTPPRDFQPFWNEWHTRVFDETPALTPHTPPDPSTPDPLGAPAVTHTFESLGGVTIGTRLVMPKEGEPVGAVVSTHGYDLPGGSPLDDTGPWAGTRLAALKIRLRGYPGSIKDTGNLTEHPSGYITHGLETPTSDWILPGAVADVVNAYRALREHFGREMPISFHGHSLGGAMAVIASSLLLRIDPPFRLVIGLPTLGHTRWRLANALSGPSPEYANAPPEPTQGVGTGMELARFIRDHRSKEGEILEALELCDTVVHARRVVCPTVCKLAKRDDVVPAPSSAAVFNALGTAPGWKWRFLVEYGHFDGGIADLRRHAMFETLTSQFLDPRIYPGRLMREWEPVLNDGHRPPDTAEKLA